MKHPLCPPKVSGSAPQTAIVAGFKQKGLNEHTRKVETFHQDEMFKLSVRSSKTEHALKTQQWSNYFSQWSGKVMEVCW